MGENGSVTMCGLEQELFAYVAGLVTAGVGVLIWDFTYYVKTGRHLDE